MDNRCTVHPPGGGTGYDWSSDFTVVKVSSGDTGGHYTLMEDNLKQGFALGLHMHRHHAETFYILEGPIDFHLDGTWVSAEAGTTIHVPPGVPHACRLPEGNRGKMLMIYQPSGFDQYLAELATFTDEDFQDAARMAALDEKYDIIQLGPVPEGPA